MTIIRQVSYIILGGICIVLLSLKVVDAKSVMLHESVAQALAFSPKLKAMNHEKDAAAQDLNRVRRRYGPSIDMMLGYGAEQYSDKTTRQADADPCDDDWSSRGDATLQLTQKVYDGGETGKTVSVYKSKLSTVNFELMDAVQETALNAIITYFDVYRYRQRVALAENDYSVHRDILRSLRTIEKAGAGNIADVTQTQTRIARVQSNLILMRGELKCAISNYTLIVGSSPQDLYFSEIPPNMPGSEGEALEWMKTGNPSLLACNARLAEAAARVNLARSEYRPKINLELNSRYYDHLDGDPSWQQSNEAMLVLRWNLFNGGQDTAAARAALSRKYESRASRDNKLNELEKTIAGTWANYTALKQQKKAFSEAVASSEKTFNAYLEQFGVGRRSLLDVLNAEKEYFQSASQLIDTSVDELIAAYRILRLAGNLHERDLASYGPNSTKLSSLVKAIHLPANMSTPIEEAVNPSKQIAMVANTHEKARPKPDPYLEDGSGNCVKAKIGPFPNTDECIQVKAILDCLGIAYNQRLGRGKVKFIRLLEGVYSPNEARRRMTEIKPITDAFTLPEDNKVSLYVGSFHNPANAKRYANHLSGRAINVTPVSYTRDMKGPVLQTAMIERKTIENIEKRLSDFNLSLELSNKN